jgi:hypothetical protein
MGLAHRSHLSGWDSGFDSDCIITDGQPKEKRKPKDSAEKRQTKAGTDRGKRLDIPRKKRYGMQG